MTTHQDVITVISFTHKYIVHLLQSSLMFLLGELHMNLDAVLSELWWCEETTCVLHNGKPGDGPDKCRLCIQFFWSELVVLCKFMLLVLLAGGKVPSSEIDTSTLISLPTRCTSVGGEAPIYKLVVALKWLPSLL
jgi:hypothetical protein